MRDDGLAPEAAGPNRADRASLTDVGPGQPGTGQVGGGEAGADPGAPDGAQPGQDKKERSPWAFLREMVLLFAIALTIALLIKTFVVQPFFIPSGSMEDTLLIGDKVLVNKLVYHLRPIQRGDIVVFNGAGSWNPPIKPVPPSSDPVVRLYDVTLGPLLDSIKSLFGTAPGQTDYIKRVIGLPGDHVVCCNAADQITVNGVPLQETSYLIPGAQPSQYPFNIVVPPGRLWVMGDNRPYSADSRLHHCGYADPETECAPYDRDGTIPEDMVVGRAFMIVWPVSRFRILPIPATFGQPGLKHAAAAARPVRSAPAFAGGAIPVRPSAPYLPLAGGFGAAVPLAALRRAIRRRSRSSRGRRSRRSHGLGRSHGFGDLSGGRRPGGRRPGGRPGT